MTRRWLRPASGFFLGVHPIRPAPNIETMLRIVQPRVAAALLPLALLIAFLPQGRAADHNLEDFIAPPGSRQVLSPKMLHADLSTGYDRRAPLDSIVYALDNGSRACRVLGKDSLWVVDYTWVFAHTGLPRRWYDAEDLLRVGDSVGLDNSSNVTLTFGTYRVGVRAGSYEQVRSEAKRLRPKVMPRALVGRLKLKLDRAQQALDRAAAKSDSARSR